MKAKENNKIKPYVLSQIPVIPTTVLMTGMKIVSQGGGSALCPALTLSPPHPEVP